MPHLNIRIISVTLLVAITCYLYGDRNPYSRHLARSFSVIESQAYYDVSQRELFDGAMTGMVAVLERAGDEHSSYIAAYRATEFEAEMRQEFGGIGVLISLRGDPRELVILSAPEPGTPASQFDIRPGDRIVAIDGKQVTEMNLATTEEVLYHMRGPVGQPVQIAITRAGQSQPMEYNIERERIQTDTILGIEKKQDGSWRYRLEDDDRIAYIRITSYSDRTYDELRETLQRLVSQGTQAAILDLRDNSGGELQTTVEMCDLFLTAGKAIVAIKDRQGRVETQFSAKSRTPFADLPLAVIVNQFSASASEIMAACLQDHRRAVIVGQRSFGKGTVQRLYAVGPAVTIHDDLAQSRLKLTSSSFWRPSGHNIHRNPQDDEESEWGVSPDEGMEVLLTSNAYQAYSIDRHNRDLYNPAGDAIFADLTDVPDAVKELIPFHDEALVLAAGHLGRQLDGESTEPEM